MPEKFENNALRKYGIYSTIVFQMLFIIGLSFWGGKKLTEYFELETQILTAAVGFLGLSLALYSTIKQLERINKDEK